MDLLFLEQFSQLCICFWLSHTMNKLIVPTS